MANIKVNVAKKTKTEDNLKVRFLCNSPNFIILFLTIQRLQIKILMPY